MSKHTSFLYKLIRKRPFSSCPLPQIPAFSASSSSSHHKDLCFSLASHLISRGLLSAAQKVIQRLISQSSSSPEAISALRFAYSKGMALDFNTYACLIRKLVIVGDVSKAESLFVNSVARTGVEPDRGLLNSMVICYCKLGKLDEARWCFDRIVEMGFAPWVGACNAMVKGLLERGRFVEGYECFCEAGEDVVLHLGCYGRLVDGLCCRGFVEEGLHVFDVMVDRGVEPTVHMCKSLIINLCKWGYVEEAEVLSAEIESYGFVVDEFMYTTIINSYCKARKVSMAMRLFMRMIKMGYEVDGYLYRTLIHGFFDLGEFDKGWILHNWMVSSGLKPDVVTYHIMLNKYCKDGNVDCARWIFNDMIRQDIALNVHCYTVLIAALYKEERFEEIPSLYQKMFGSGVVPDHVLFFTLVKNYSGGEALSFALTILQAIVRASCNIDISDPVRPMNVMEEIESLLEKIELSNSGLASMVFSIYMIALCVVEKCVAASHVMEKMVSLGILPLPTAFNSYIQLLTHKGFVEYAELLLEVMEDKGLVPNESTFSIMANELCKNGDFLSSIDILNKVEERGIKPSVAFYDAIISCLGKLKMVREAERFFDRMLALGTNPDETIFVTMISIYSKNGWAKEAQDLFEKMAEYNLKPSSHAYTALIHGLVKKNMTVKGCSYLDRMITEGHLPNNVLYTSLIKQYLRKREFEFAFRLVYLMKISEIDEDVLTYITLVSGVCRNIRKFDGKWYLRNRKEGKGKEKLLTLLRQSTLLPRGTDWKLSISSQEKMKSFALNLMQRVKEYPLEPHLHLYNGMISGFCWARSMEEAYEHVNLMQEKGLSPNHVTFTILIDGHIQFGEVDKAIELFNDINANGFVLDRVLFNTLIHGFCKVGRLLDALSLLHIMQKRGLFASKSSYEKILSSLCRYHSSVDAFRICEDMLAQGYFPCWNNLRWLHSILCKDNKLAEAHAIKDLTVDSNDRKTIRQNLIANGGKFPNI